MPQPRFKLNQRRRARIGDGELRIRRGDRLTVEGVVAGQPPSYFVTWELDSATITESRLALLWGEDVDGDPRTG